MFVKKLCSTLLPFLVYFLLVKTSVASTGSIVGGQSEITSKEDLNNVKSKVTAALTQLSQQDGGVTLELKEVKKATKQTVAGVLYTVEAIVSSAEESKTCTFKIWVQLWLDKEESEIKCPDKTYTVSKTVTRSKRQIPGGKFDADDETVKELQDKIVEDLQKLKDQEDGEHFEFKNFAKVSQRLAAGPIWEGQVELLSKTTNKNHKCDYSVWEQPWLNWRETNVTCPHKTFRVVKGEQRSKRDTSQIVGGPTEVSAETLNELRTKVSESLVKIEGEQDGAKLSILNISGARQQVVAGVLYTINAQLDTADGAKDCVIKVWEKPWLHLHQVHIDCGKEIYQVELNDKPKGLLSRVFENEDEPESELSAENLFDKFKAKYNRVYEDENEHAMRLRIFKQNLFQIRQLNKFETGTAKYGITDFADLTLEEYRQRTGLLVPEEESNYIPNTIADIPDIDLPESFDWRENNAVTAVKNQGTCGSCWAFSVTGNIEGLNAIKTGTLESFSEQELLDCDKTDSACMGGLPDTAYKAIEQIGGLETEDEYPYKARKHQCTFNKTLHHVSIRGAVDLPKKDEIAIAKWLVQNGPVSIGINANAMQFYRGGISHPWKVLCRASSLDHGVLLVGFGIAKYPVFNKTLPYWIVKNSWGPRWGEQGYYRVFRGDNTCGVSSMASSAVLA